MATIEGLEVLSRRLVALGTKTGISTLRKATRRAAAPVLRQMKARVPVGTVAHRTYKGRLVTPGFLKRSIRLSTKVNRRTGSISAIMGVRREAFYGINFLDLHTLTISRRGKRAIKPYTLRRRPWFLSMFLNNQSRMEGAIRDELKTAINQAVKA